MRGGRTEPRLVSRTTYNAHAQARLGPVGSFADFVQQQRQTDGILSDSGGAPSDLRGRSPLPDVSPLSAGSGRKRLPASPDPNTQPTNRQRGGNWTQSVQLEQGQNDIEQEDFGEVQQEFGVGNGHVSSLFGGTGDATARRPMLDSAEHYVCSVILQLLYCLSLLWRTKYTRIG